MKKFLSLVLALIMTMSLVTISAGATEYKDLTDKDEIQYEEAVAVLNRIGVITGYDDGSFRPETELTRGAAAKIIVSLLIGPEAASNLPNTYAPYPDVPANHTFAGVISYCKTAGIISGYGDGTFKPANSLTGYAFAKMLLGAIGYDSKIQGYTDTGWTMNVARDGNMAGLFNRIEFDGAAAVNREQACQLALNTLKATMVEYTGGLSVTAGDAHVTTNPTLTYKISNQSYATNISNRKASNIGNANVDNHYTVEFGEEHFKDLRLNDEHGTKYSTDKDGKTILNVARDEFGRPSNKWSFKKVTIGTFPIQPDYVYTERVIHRQDEKVTDASKVRALELSGFNLQTDDLESRVINTTLWVNGVEEPVTLGKVADIADWTDNGTTVEVYISEDDSDFIQDVVVIKTQLMEIKNVKSEAVSLKLYDDGSDNTDGDGIDGKEGVIGFNSRPLDKKVNDVEVNDECYKTLSGMKVGDIVAVIPVAPEHENEEKFDVSRVYAPETVSGELTWVDTYGTEKDAATGIAVTVGGTDYNVALWNKDLTDIDGTSIRVTRKDVTLYLDEFGNALLAKNVGSTSDYMVIGGYHSGLVDGKVVTYADGWDIKGNEISLNIGNARYDQIGGDAQTRANFPIGSLVHYSSSTTSKYAEWKLDEQGVFDVASKRTGETNPYTVKASNSRLVLNDYWDDVDHKAYNNAANDYYSKTNDGVAAYNDKLNDNVYVDDSGVKVIYLTMGDDGEVDSVEVKSGMQNISTEEILGTKSDFADSVKRAQACVGLKSDSVTADSLVKAIVVKLESGNADLKDLVYISRYLGSAGKAPGADNTQRPVYGYEAHFVGTDDWADEVTIYSYQALDKGDFARARKPATVPEGVKNVSEENFYALTEYVKTLKALSTMQTGEIVFGEKAGYNIQGNKTLIKLTNYAPSTTNFSKAWPGEDKINELDLGDQGIVDILSLRGADIIDLTRHEIQSTSELVDELKELNKDNLSLKVSALYNDDKDSDGFRDVHVLIITDEVKGSGSIVTPEPTGAVKFASGLTGVGTLSKTSINRTENGGATMNFTLTKPNWAYGKNTLAANVKVLYDVYLDNSSTPYAHGSTAGLYDVDVSGTPNMSGNGTDFTVTNFDILRDAGMTAAEAKGHDITVVLTSVDWRAARVEFYLNGKLANDLMTPTYTREYMPTYAQTSVPLAFYVPNGAANGVYDGVNATWTATSGVRTDLLTTAQYSNVAANASSSGPQFTSATASYYPIAKGGEVVRIDIKTTTDVAEKFSVYLGKNAFTAKNTALSLGIKTDNLIQPADRPANYNETPLGNINVQIQGDSAWADQNPTANSKLQLAFFGSMGSAGYTGTAIKGFKIYGTLANGSETTPLEVTTYNLSSAPVEGEPGVLTVDVKGDVKITVTKVEIIGVVPMKAEPMADGSIRITYSETLEALDQAKVTSDKKTGTNALSVERDGSALVIKPSGTDPWVDGEVITIAASAVTGASKAKSDQIVITTHVDATGGVTLGINE